MAKQGLIIDSFAGGGGASLGIAWALGRSPDIAVNHDGPALAMHEANHPDTRHVLEDVWRANLRSLIGRRKVDLLWASPDCRHFSRAKGSKPVSKKIRSLAWVICRWAEQVRPRVIVLENVREFADWGPLVPVYRCRSCDWRGTEGQAKLARVHRRCPRCNASRLIQTDEHRPDPNRRGLTFRRWTGRLRNLGYEVAYKTLDAADYGAPTHRRRLFLVARCDGRPIEWPEASHADPAKLDDQPLFSRLKPWRTAAECIDWSLPCPSIFDRQRPLADKTMRRIAMGLWRYVLNDPQPFIVRCDHGGDHFRGQSIDQPLSTVTGHHGFGVVAPVLSKYHGQKAGESRCHSLDRGFATLDTQNRFGLVAATLAKFYGGVVGHSIDKPIGTVTAVDHHGLVAANLVKFRGESNGASVDQPMPTVTSGAGAARPAGAAHALGIASAYLARFNHGEKQWNGMDEPLGTITSQGNKFGLVYAFLVKYFGTAIGQPLDEPLHTQTGKHRFGLVAVEVAPGQHEPAVAIDVPGIGPCVIADIGLRMLSPRELARAQGFPDTYLLTGSKSNQVARLGNSVPPQLAEAMVRANCDSPLQTA